MLQVKFFCVYVRDFVWFWATLLFWTFLLIYVPCQLIVLSRDYLMMGLDDPELIILSESEISVRSQLTPEGKRRKYQVEEFRGGL